MALELDAAAFHIYGLARDEVEHVMDSFFVVRDNEIKALGEFRSKQLILERYDAMAATDESGYVCPVDPPPGHGARHQAETRPGWADQIWPTRS